LRNRDEITSLIGLMKCINVTTHNDDYFLLYATTQLGL